MDYEPEEHTEALPTPSDKRHWAALFRGQIITTTTNKFVSYVKLADQKAQAMIILNSILIPFTISWLKDPVYNMGAFIAIITAVISIFTAILCIYPKRRRGQKPDGTYNLLHFGDIGRMKEEQYLALINPVFNDMNALSEHAIKDLHDIARRIIIPKFFWLKISYGCFFTGNLVAVLWTVYTVWTGQPQ